MSLYVDESGNRDAQTIVFIHGGGISGWMWRQQVEHFQDYHCLVPDLPEHGKSINEKPLTIRDCSERIIELIQTRANGKKAHLVGHSLGGKVIVDLLTVNPEVVDHAIIGSALFRPIPFLKVMCNIPTYKFTVWMLKSDRMLAWQTDQFKFKELDSRKKYMKDTRDLTVESLDRIYKEVFLQLKVPEGLGKVKSAVSNPKILVVAGAKEPKAMRQSVSDLVYAIPESKGVLIKNALHHYPWVLDQVLNRLIRGWLQKDEVIADEALQVISKGILL